jgi:hypothetical protein
MIAMSMGTVYRIVRGTGIPLFASERYSARMFSLPLVLLIVVAGIFLDHYLRATVDTAYRRYLALLALLVLAIDMAAGARLFRVEVSAGLFGPSTIDAAATVVAQRADPTYVLVLVVGAAMTLLTGAGLMSAAMRERKRGQVIGSR